MEPCKQEGRSHEEQEEQEEGADTAEAAGVSVVVAQVESGGEGEEPVGASTQEVDSDDQTNTQVSEILSSTL